MQIKDLTGGLVLDVDPSALQPNQLQEAQNITVREAPGIVKTRQGRTALNDIVYTGATDIYYQNILSTPGIIAVGSCLVNTTPGSTNLKAMWVGDKLIGAELGPDIADEDIGDLAIGTTADYATGHWDFTEYNKNLIMCDGNRNYRFADNMGCGLFALFTNLWEYGETWQFFTYLFDVPTTFDYHSMACNPFILATTGDITSSQDWCCYEWEKQQLLSETIGAGKILAALEVDFDVLVDTYIVTDLGFGTLASSLLYTMVNYLSLPCELGNLVPAAATATIGAAGNPSGTYTYKVTLVNRDGYESNGSAESNSVSPSSEQVGLTFVCRSYRRNGWKRRIYRNENGGATWKRVGEIGNNDQTTFTDNIADVNLGVAIPSVNSAPPAFRAVKEHIGLLYGVRTYKPEEVWYCNDRSEWEYFDSLNYELFGINPSNGYALASLGPYLVVLHDIKLFLLNTRDLPNVISQALVDDGARNSKVVFEIGNAIIIGNLSGIASFNGVDAVDLTKAISGLFLSTEATTVCDVNGDCAAGEVCIGGRCVPTTTVHPDYIANMRIACAHDDILVSYTSAASSSNDKTLLISRTTGVVDCIINEGYVDLCVDAKKKNIYGLTSSYRVYRLLYGEDNDGSSLSWVFRTKEFDVEHNGYTTSKQGTKAKLDCNPNGGTITVQVYLDGTLSQTRTITGSSRTNYRWRLPDKVFHRISYRISGTGKQYFYSLTDELVSGEI